MIKISRCLTPQLWCLLVQRGEASNCPDLVTCVFPKHARAAPKYFYSAQPLRAKYPFDLEGNFTKQKNKISSDSLVIKQKVILPFFQPVTKCGPHCHKNLTNIIIGQNYLIFSQIDPISTSFFRKNSRQLMSLFPIKKILIIS